MRLPARLCEALRMWLVRRHRNRPYYHIQGYMSRWWILGGSNPARDERSEQYRGWKRSTLDSFLGRFVVAARLHCIHRGDADRHFHDHPGWSISIILRNGYTEVMPASQDQDPVLDSELTIERERRPGQIVFRHADHRHRIEIGNGQPCWSIFIMGPKRQIWGFYTPQGKVPWREYLGLKESPA